MANKRGLTVNNDGTFGTWSRDETLQLLNNIKKQLFNWSVVKINGKTERECQSRFQELIRNIHNILNLMETLTEADIGEIAVEQDQKGPSQYPNRDRQKISKPDVLTPLQLFIKQKKEMGESNVRNRLRTQYVGLEDTEKMKWIQMAVNENEEARNILSSDEQRILRGEPKPLKNCHNKKTKSATGSHQQLTSIEKSKLIEITEKAKDERMDGVENVDEVEVVDKFDDGGEQSTAPTKRKRRERSSKLKTSQSTDKPGKKVRVVENGEPARISSVPYHYYKHFIYRKNGNGARKAYLSLDREKKIKLRKEHERIYNSYSIKLHKYMTSISRNEIEELNARIREEEENESSDPDDNDEYC